MTRAICLMRDHVSVIMQIESFQASFLKMAWIIDKA